MQQPKPKIPCSEKVPTRREARRNSRSSRSCSSSGDQTGSTKWIAEALFGRPVLPLDAFAFGRSFGRRARKLFPEKLLHVLKGVRSGINEISERQAAQAGGESQ